MDKEVIRADMLCRRRSLFQEQVVHLSRRAQQRLLSTAFYATANSVALYRPVHQETDTETVFHAAIDQGKTVSFPRIEGETLVFVAVTSLAQLVIGKFGVAEPGLDLPVTEQVPEITLVPGVAFDRRGHRLGYGRGFYDRYLSRCSGKTYSVGLAYAFQLCDAIPKDDHDQRLDALVTDREIMTWHDKVPGLT